MVHQEDFTKKRHAKWISAPHIGDVAQYLLLLLIKVFIPQFGNAYITAVWRFSNVTNDWLVSFGDVVPAPAGPIPNVTLPLFLTTPNATANATANVSAANSTSIQRAVISASNGLLAAIGSANESVANATSQYVGPELEIVLATQASPST
jgi:hypothetical protein